MRAVIKIGCFAFAVAGCNFHKDKAKTETPVAAVATPGFAEVKAQFFGPNCIKSGCHDVATSANGINFDTYEKTKGEVEKIDEQVFVEKLMPYGTPELLTAADKALLKAWLDAGAPEAKPVSLDDGPAAAPDDEPAAAPDDEDDAVAAASDEYD